MSIKGFLERLRWKKRGVKVPPGSQINVDADIGFGTRINGPLVIKGKGRCSIGRYCALGADVKIITSNHQMRFPNLQCSVQRKIGAVELDVAKGDVMIGHNVWIGDSVIILTGLKVGHGAVIGAGAVVTRNIPDFGVAVGVPAAVRRLRFPSYVCDQLAELAWWNWPPDRIARNVSFFEMDLTQFPESERLERLIKA